MIFDWATPLPYNLEQARDLGLAKGVIAREGIMRASGDKMSRDNIYTGSGAMRGIAPAGLAVIDVDHAGADLPATYDEKYGAGIRAFPQGHVIDAHAVDAEDGLAETQAVMMIHAVPLRDAISRGDARGCSVVDAVRRRTCTGAVCTYDGSAYVMNTVALELEPDAAGTWIKMVGPEDVGTIITG